MLDKRDPTFTTGVTAEAFEWIDDEVLSLFRKRSHRSESLQTFIFPVWAAD